MSVYKEIDLLIQIRRSGIQGAFMFALDKSKVEYLVEQELVEVNSDRHYPIARITTKGEEFIEDYNKAMDRKQQKITRLKQMVRQIQRIENGLEIMIMHL